MDAHPMTAVILDQFQQISAIPRRSKDEARIRAWLIDWAQAHEFPCRSDAAGNILIVVPGSPGHESAPVVILQGHMDMVCEKTPESTHNFDHDPIVPTTDGEWLVAEGTTLGADNGIAIAMALVAATQPDLVHPPLELLFTVDEETGLTGANALESGFLEGTFLLNIDSEDEGVVTVGCAGGIDTHLYLPVPHEAAPTGWVGLELHAGGMSGGHSGVDIHRMRANAIRVLTRVLFELGGAFDLRLADLTGGSAHNAIPRDARAKLLVDPEDEAALRTRVDTLSTALRAEFSNTDPNLALTLSAWDGEAARVLSIESCIKALDFLMVIPHGVAAMSTDIEGLVETSNNQATVAIIDEHVVVLTSQRSSVESRLAAHTHRVEGVARLGGGTARSGNGYPPWQPNMDSALLARSKAIYTELYGKEPVVEVIHAGLECGIIGSKYPGMDMLSIGPTIRFPHSPDERLHIPTIGKVWDFLAAILASIALD